MLEKIAERDPALGPTGTIFRENTGAINSALWFGMNEPNKIFLTALTIMSTITIGNQRVEPSKIVCIGRNYVEHITELGNELPEEMVVFMKPNSALSSTLSAKCQDEPLHYEGELCFVVLQGRLGAVGFGLDLTRRALQTKLKNKGLPWERAKAFDGAALFSTFVSMEFPLDDLSFSLAINDLPVQEGSPQLMIYKPDTILRELSSFLTLNDGDIIMTGTPKGVGEITPGDTFVGRVFARGKEIIAHTWQVMR
jgi:2-keto-4-pentenoate hydratase/2-oxohepta-3-ene-1,7-dioic acid hydratase in catechol pathway